MNRPSKRKNNELRNIDIQINTNKHAEGSCLISFGDTKVICTASFENKVPAFLKGKGKGWISAEYGMLPRSTNTRNDREAIKGQNGRTKEIQRLISRSLRAVVDLNKMGEKQIRIDCDVIQADGGTRTASITGGYIAMYLAFANLKKRKIIEEIPLKDYIAAISCGIYKGEAVVDLDYIEDSNAQTDANFVMNSKGEIIEIQMCAEQEPFSKDQLTQLLDLASDAINSLISKQKKALLGDLIA